MNRREKIEAELNQIKERGGGLVSPRAVVEFARNPKTALYGEFEWDDGAAAQEYRLEQARRLLRVYVSVIGDTGPPVRVWASLPSDRKPGGGYRAMVDVMSDDRRRAELLEMAYRDLETFRIKYRRIKELAPVFEAMRKLKRPKHAARTA